MRARGGPVGLFVGVFVGVMFAVVGAFMLHSNHGLPTRITVTSCQTTRTGNSTSTSCVADYDFAGQHYSGVPVQGSVPHSSGIYTARIDPSSPDRPTIPVPSFISWGVIALGVLIALSCVVALLKAILGLFTAGAFLFAKRQQPVGNPTGTLPTFGLVGNSSGQPSSQGSMTQPLPPVASPAQPAMATAPLPPVIGERFQNPNQ